MTGDPPAPDAPPALQDRYPEDTAHCYGCGRLNPSGHHLKTRLTDPRGRESVSRFTPEPYHTAIPGYVYGGLIASLVDCHGTGAAAGAKAREEGRPDDAEPPRFVTAALQVDFLAPTPLGPELVLRGRVEESGERKVVVAVSVTADGRETARGRVVAVRMPESMVGGHGT